MESFLSFVSEEDIRREKRKARQLRKTAWWKRKCAVGVCHFCGRKTRPADLTMEHVIPLIRGGTSSRSNLVPACKHCNSAKKYLLPMEWEAYRQTLLRDPWS